MQNGGPSLASRSCPTLRCFNACLFPFPRRGLAAFRRTVYAQGIQGVGHLVHGGEHLPAHGTQNEQPTALKIGRSVGHDRLAKHQYADSDRQSNSVMCHGLR